MRLLLAALPVLVLSACATPGSAPGSLSGTRWQADTVAGKACTMPSTVEFLDAQRASGNLGCNRYTAVYELDGTKLKFGPVSSTRKACAPDLMAQDAAFTKVLENTRGVRRDGNGLTFYGADDKALVKLTPEKPGECK